MSEQKMSLPYSPRLDVGTLSGIFDHKTNSYKYLFFLALMDFLIESDFATQQPIETKTLGARMLAKAWYPHHMFKLTFGTQDRIAHVLDAYAVELSTSSKKNLPTEKALTKHYYQKIGEADELLRYVPQRLIRPFFGNELKGKRDSVVDALIVELSGNEFVKKKPLYMFMDGGLVVHPEWLGYLYDNARIVREWTLWNFLEYMQKRNPNVPNIAGKLERPAQRESLQKQRDFWNLAFRYWEGDQYRCPYSRHPLKSVRYDLDHFIPWRFVTHDRMWDLIPTTREANRQKSSSLPSTSYLSVVGTLHEKAIQSTRRAMEVGAIGDEAWNNRVEDYLVDFQIDGVDKLLRPGNLRTKYNDVVEPLLRMAAQQGFEPGWTYAE